MKIIFTGLYPVLKYSELIKKRKRKVEKIENTEKTNN